MWLLLAVKLKPFSWNVLGKKKKRSKVIVSVEDILFVFLVVQTVMATTTFLPRIYRWVDFFPQSVDS